MDSPNWPKSNWPKSTKSKKPGLAKVELAQVEHPPPGPVPADAPTPDRPKFRAFFTVSRHQFRSFCLSLCVFSWNYDGFFEGREPSKCTFGLGYPVKPGGTPKFNEKTPRQTQKGEMAGEGKKKRNFGRSGGRCQNNAKPGTSGAPNCRPPLPRFRVWFGVGYNNKTTQQQHNNNTRKIGQNRKTLKLAKVGLAKVGHDRL